VNAFVITGQTGFGNALEHDPFMSDHDLAFLLRAIHVFGAL
jgi:hypothetical protein